MPTTATRSSAQNHVKAAKPSPVEIISTDTRRSSARAGQVVAAEPTIRVSSAEPRSVPVTIVPICTPLNPSSTR